MAEIRCPMCGKANPEGRAECMYCGSRLKPLVVPQQPESAPQPPPAPKPAEPARPPASGDVTLMRSALRDSWQSPADEAEEEEPEVDEAAPPPEEAPEWLQRLRTQTGTAGQRTQARSRPAQPPSPEPPPKAEPPEPTLTRTQGSADKTIVSPGTGRPRATGDLLHNLRIAARRGAEPEEPPEEKKEEPSDDVPDWLDSLRKQSLGPPEPPTPEPEPEAAMSDWLRSLREHASEEDEEAAPAEGQTLVRPTEAEPEPTEDFPDWLRTLGPAGAAPAAPVEPTPPPGEASEDLPDWLRSMRSETPPAAEPESPAPTPAPAEPAADVPDWLREMQAAAPPPAEPEATPAEVPDWLLAMEAAGPPPAEPEASTPEAPDWLQEMEAAAELPAEAVPTEPAEVPDWLRDLQAAAPPPSEPAIELPAEVAPAEPADLPDWLRSMRETAPPAEAAPEPPTEAAPAEPVPAEAAPEPPAEAALAEPPPAEPTEVPDWLRSMEAAAPPEPGPPEPPAPLPDWLETLPPAQFGPVEAAPEPPEPPAAEPAADMPDWLASLTSAPASAESQTSPFYSSVERAEEAPPAQVADELPDWLAALRPSQAEPDVAAPDVSETPTSTTLPPETAPAEESAPTIASSSQAAPAAPAQPDDLERATLPPWLEAMRPAPVVQPGVSSTSEYEETTGPLAGMRGVIAAEPAIALPNVRLSAAIPPTMSETHAAQARLIQALVKEENATRQATRPVAGRTILALFERWLVFAVVAIFVLVPFALGTPLALFAPPSLFPVETVAARDTLAGLPVEKPVLVAFEYDPGASGEMDLLAAALLDHLAARGLPIVAISTRPLGPGLAQAALDRALPPTAGEETLGRVVNLGYLPGGALSLPAFALDPRAQAVSDFTGETPNPEAPPPNVWQRPVLLGVRGLSDFGAVVVISNSPETVRAWIEQVAFYRRSVSGTLQPPMVAMVSAAAEPLVQPYFMAENADSSLQGLVSGAIGAAGYQQLSGTSDTATPPALAAERWDAQGLGLLAAVVIILAGALLFGSFGLLRRRGSA